MFISEEAKANTDFFLLTLEPYTLQLLQEDLLYRGIMSNLWKTIKII